MLLSPFISPAPSSPPASLTYHVHKSVLYVCVSIEQGHILKEFASWKIAAAGTQESWGINGNNI